MRIESSGPLHTAACHIYVSGLERGLMVFAMISLTAVKISPEDYMATLADLMWMGSSARQI